MRSAECIHYHSLDRGRDAHCWPPTACCASLRRRATPTPCDVRVVYIDDPSLKGQRYGAIICDLERRCTIDLLPDREGGTVADWLTEHPGIELVCRDRGNGFCEVAAKGASQALQICDRWHRSRTSPLPSSKP